MSSSSSSSSPNLTSPIAGKSPPTKSPPPPPQDPPPPPPPPPNEAQASASAASGGVTINEAVASLFAPVPTTSSSSRTGAAAADDLLFSGVPLLNDDHDAAEADDEPRQQGGVIQHGGGGVIDGGVVTTSPPRREGEGLPSSSSPAAAAVLTTPPRVGDIRSHEEPGYPTFNSYGSNSGSTNYEVQGRHEARGLDVNFRWNGGEGSTAAGVVSPSSAVNRESPARTGSPNRSAADASHAVATVSSPWQFDETVIMCSSCHSPFNWINRRHHCRLCGHIFCDKCTSHRALIPPSQIVLTPAGFQFNKRPVGLDEPGVTASFTPQEDPDRMLTYLAPTNSSSSSASSNSTAPAEPPSSTSDPTVSQERTILYGRGLEERMHLAREPLRVCHSCYPRLVPLQPQLIAANSNMMRYNDFDPHDVRRLFNSPLAFTMGHEIRKAAHTLHNLLPLPRRLGLLTNSINATAAGGGDEFTPGMFTTSSTEVPCRDLQQEVCGPGGAGGGGGPIQPNLANIDGVRIPAKLLEMAKGIAVLTILKGGLGFAGMEMGTGLVIARTREYDSNTGTGWTPPSAIGTIGVSWGALIGAQVTDHVFLLMDDNAVNIMFGQSSMTLGVDVGIAVGPVGRAAEADLSLSPGQRASGIYTYSLSKGLYAGISLDGKVVVTRNDVNEKFYGRRISGQEILRGHNVPTPPAAQPLYEALARCHVYASGRHHQQPQEHPYFRRNQQQLLQVHPTLSHCSSSPYRYSLQGPPPPSTTASWATDPVMGEYGEVPDDLHDSSDPFHPSTVSYYGGGNRPPAAPSLSTTTSPHTMSSPTTTATAMTTSPPAFQASPTIVSLPPPPATAARPSPTTAVTSA